MGGQPARTARILATLIALSCLIALLAPTAAQAAPVHRPFGSAAVSASGPLGPGNTLATGLDTVAVTTPHLLRTGGQHARTLDAGVLAAAPVFDSASPRGPPGRRF